MRKTLGDWMIENLGEDSIEKYWSEKNDKTPYDYTIGSGRKIWIKCQEKEYHEYDVSPHHFTNGSRCPYCTCKNGKVHPKDSFAQWGIDNICKDFLEKYWSKKNEINPWNLSTKNNKKIWIKCQENLQHDDYETMISNFTQNGSRCPFCSSSSKYPPIEKSLYFNFPISRIIWSDKNKLTPLDFYKISHKEVWWKCNCGKHEDYKRQVGSSVKYNFRCPKCSEERNESIYQEKTRLYLNEIGYELNHEYECSIIAKNPITNRLLPFDNEVVKLKLIIEVNGSQHYSGADGHFVKTKEEKEDYLGYIKWKDNLKKEYVLNMGYHFLELPYWSFSNDSYKEKINQKIDEILKLERN